MKKTIYILITVLITSVVLMQCRPALLLPSKKTIIGTWLASPESLEEVWTFFDDNTLLITLAGDTVQYPNTEDGQYQIKMEYSIEKKLSSQRLVLPSYFYDPNRTNKEPFFRILRLNKKSLHLYLVDNNIKGSIQKEFRKQD